MDTTSSSIFANPSALTYTSIPSPALTSNAVFKFHSTLPTYNGPTNLIPLPILAKSLNLQNLFLKNESFRFGDLPSFKPLGLSWAIRNAIIAELSEEASMSIPEDISLSELASRAKEGQIKLIAASDGKLGKAVARLGKLFGVQGINTRIFIPEGAAEEVKRGVKEEGAEVLQVAGNFEDAMREACLHAVAVDGILIDIDEVENYEDVPRWIVEGYSTIFKELDIQLEGERLDLVVVPVGIGGLAQAAVTHYRTSPSHFSTRILAVEPKTAAALNASLRKGELVSVENREETIVKSLDYRTLAEKAWEVLKNGIDATTVVGDEEVKRAMEELKEEGIEVGPCCGSVLAGLRNVLQGNGGVLGLSEESTVVLIGTEGIDRS